MGHETKLAKRYIAGVLVSAAAFVAAALCGLMLVVALLCSWLGTLCWNEASQRLPTTLAGQLIVFESLAGLGDGRLSGTVLVANGTRPLAGAQVRIADGMVTRTNERGEWTITDAPERWADIQNSLGSLLITMGLLTDQHGLFDKAVAVFLKIAQSRGRTTAPLVWATALANIGSALKEKGVAARNLECLKQAAEAFEQAGQVFTELNLESNVKVMEHQRDHVRLMFDIMTLAFQTDSTRVVSFMYVNEGSNRSYKEIEVAEGHHDLSHHGNDSGKQAKISKINHYHVSMLAHLLQRMRSVTEGEGNLLDHSLVMYGSGLGDGNRHNHDNLPIALFGRAGGRVAPGRHVRYQSETPLANFYLSAMHMHGSQVESFGDSKGQLEHLQRS